MSTSYPIRLDARRRPTLPSELIAEAGLGQDDDLVAYSEQGRIVISTRARLLSSVQEMFRAARAQDQVDPVQELLEDRARSAAAEGERFPR